MNKDKCDLTYVWTNLKKEREQIEGIPINVEAINTFGMYINGREDEHYELNFRD